MSRIIDLSAMHLKSGFGGDGRMYLPVSMFGRLYYGLLDYWAGVSVIGGEGWARLSRLRVPLLSSDYTTVKVANGQLCQISGTVQVPVTVGDEFVRLARFCIVPSLTSELILGIDFWKLMNIVPDVTTITCSTALVDSIEISDLVVGHDSLTSTDRARLDSLVNKYKATLGRPGLGCTHLVKHRIDTVDAEPVRSRILQNFWTSFIRV